MDSSPGCWAAYGVVLAREYSDSAYGSEHRITVDAYAAQHPGRPSPQSIKSVALHLASLCLVLEHGFSMARATAAIRTGASSVNPFVWLEPPARLGSLNVADVAPADTPAKHQYLVRAWASGVWAAWAEHHTVIYSWLPLLGAQQVTAADRPTAARQGSLASLGGG